mgnify:CR=1 FL=1
MGRVCTCCGIEQDESAFSRRSDNGRLRSECRSCVRRRVAEWKARNPERVKATNRATQARMRRDPERYAKVLAQDAARRRAKNPRKGKAFTAQCERCHQEFNYVYRQRHRTVCDLCRKHDNAWHAYGLTGPQAEDLRSRGACDICGTDSPGGRYGRWHIDHDHETGKVRGLLCSPCNTSLGLLGDDPARIRRAAEYLERNTAHVS